MAEDVIHLHFLRENSTIELSEVALGWNQVKSLCPNRNAFVLVQTAPWSLMEKEAREYITAQWGEWPAVAVVVYTSAQKIFAQVATRAAGLSETVRIFDDMDSAFRWFDEIRQTA